jgi:hypothetical protein
MAENHVALAESLHAKQDKMAPEQVNMRDVTGRPKELAATAPREAGVMDEQFPTDSLLAKDARDRVTEAKLQLQTPGQVGYTPFGKLEAKDSDFEWYQRKAAAVEVANFQAWFAKEFDRMSPADKKRAKELYPEFYRQRKKLLKQQTKNLFELARLKLEGVQDMDDLKTQYMAESGRLDLGPLQNLLHPEQVFSRQNPEANDRRDYAQAKFQRGLLSPFRVFGAEATGTFDMSNQWDGQSTRYAQSQNYQASTAGTGRKLGLKYGFPPFGNVDPVEEQDAQWWQKLQGQL